MTSGERPALGRPWRRTIAHVLATQGRTCELRYPGICQGTATTATHIVPRSQGGSDHPPNLKPACLPCVRHRGADPLPGTDEDRRSRKWT